jgi:hypothetical protein
MFPPAKPLSERVCGSLKLLKLLKLLKRRRAREGFAAAVFWNYGRKKKEVIQTWYIPCLLSPRPPLASCLLGWYGEKGG